MDEDRVQRWALVLSVLSLRVLLVDCNKPGMKSNKRVWNTPSCIQYSTNLRFCSLAANLFNRCQERWTDAQAFRAVGIVELHLSGLIGTASRPDVQKIG
jgi:hypothetical protein